LRIAYAGLLLAVELALAGCGGSSPTTSTQSTHTVFAHRLSARAYRARLHAINAKATRSTKIVATALKSARSVSEVHAALQNYANDTS
jgi:ABC-type glycerol-3-phosphate transport system substrate-binding protein